MSGCIKEGKGPLRCFEVCCSDIYRDTSVSVEITSASDSPYTSKGNSTVDSPISLISKRVETPCVSETAFANSLAASLVGRLLLLR